MTSRLVLILLFISLYGFSQSAMEYEPSKDAPFGRYNPKAPKELLDFQDLIGESKCTSISRNADQSWAKPVDMIWRWKYIMNGMAVQDETLKNDGRHSGSIRQYSKDSLRWNVHYYATGATPVTLPVWNGNKKDGKIVLYREQQAPNGMDGFYRLTFYEISKKSFKWIGEWVDKTEKFAFPTWKIACTKEE